MVQKLPTTTTGQATSVSSGATCTAVVNGVSMTVQLARDLTVAVGDVLLVHLVDQTYYGCCRLFAAAAAAVDDYEGPDPNAASYDGETVIMPVFTGTYRDSTWKTSTTDVLQGVQGGYGNATGVALYGDKPATLAGATVWEAIVRVRSFTAAATTLWLVTETEQPAGPPTLTLSTAGPNLDPGETADFVLPTSWGQALVDGTAGGLALFDADGTPFARYAGLGTDAAAWRLVLSWAR